MSGAKLQAAGQMRNVYPFMVSHSQKITHAFTSGTIGNRTAISASGLSIPFDMGPDKASMVFIALHSVHITKHADVYTPTAPILQGALYYQANNGKKAYLSTFAGAFSGGVNSAVTDPIVSEQPVTGERLDNLGHIGFENDGTIFGSAVTITLTLYLNIGLYGIYRENDISDELGQVIARFLPRPLGYDNDI